MIEPDGQFLRNQDWIVKHNLCRIENLIRAATNLTKKLKNLKTSNLWTNHEQFLPKEFLSSWWWLVELYTTAFSFSPKFSNSRISWHPADAGRGGLCDVLRAPNWILSDCDDLQARATRGLSIVFCLSLPFISLIVIAKIFFCHPTKLFLRDSQNSFWGRCSFSSNSMTRLHGMMHSGSIDWAWIYAVISSIQGEKNEGININITN